MQMSNLAHDAHRIAVDKGFWQAATSRSVVATKVALIHTEIAEFHEALDLASESFDEIAEEAADIVIRALDLAVAIDLPLGVYEGMRPAEEGKEIRLGIEEIERRIVYLHDAAAQITRADRRDDSEARMQAICALVFGVFRLADLLGITNFFGRIRIKMERNRNRPRLHGKAY